MALIAFEKVINIIIFFWIGTCIVIGVIKLTEWINEKRKTTHKFIEYYKGHTIYQDMRNQYYISLDVKERQLSKRLTIEWIKMDIDATVEKEH